MVLEVLECNLELDHRIGVGPVFVISLLQGSQLWILWWCSYLVVYNYTRARAHQQSPQPINKELSVGHSLQDGIKTNSSELFRVSQEEVHHAAGQRASGKAVKGLE